MPHTRIKINRVFWANEAVDKDKAIKINKYLIAKISVSLSGVHSQLANAATLDYSSDALADSLGSCAMLLRSIP